MCRFILYHGPPLKISLLVTEPVHSLIHQSVHSLERNEPLNGDGFGVAWYAPQLSGEPGVYRSITPAWNNRNLHDLARVVESSCILAHVRAATAGLAVMETNCHPFRSGPWAFMHNGIIGNWSLAVRRALMAELSDEAFRAIGGTTDSEHLFALCLDRLPKDPQPCAADAMAEALTGALERAVELVSEHGGGAPSFLNCVLTDGCAAVVSRVSTAADGHTHSLYLHRGKRYVCEGGVCRMVDPGHGAAVIVSSERLSGDSGWEPVPPGHLVVIQGEGQVECRKLELARGAREVVPPEGGG